MTVVVRRTAVVGLAITTLAVLAVLAALSGVVLGRVLSTQDPVPVVVTVQAAQPVEPVKPTVLTEEEDGAGLLSDGRGYCLRGGLCADRGPIPADWLTYLQTEWQVYLATATADASGVLPRFDLWLAAQ